VQNLKGLFAPKWCKSWGVTEVQNLKELVVVLGGELVRDNTRKCSTGSGLLSREILYW
jgi:hypothetical protein